MTRDIPDIISFIAVLQEQFDDSTTAPLLDKTEFRNLKQWNSLQALVIVSCINWHYSVTISGDELRKAKTIRDIYQMVVSKIEN